MRWPMRTCARRRALRHQAGQHLPGRGATQPQACWTSVSPAWPTMHGGCRRLRAWSPAHPTTMAPGAVAAPGRPSTRRTDLYLAGHRAVRVAHRPQGLPTAAFAGARSRAAVAEHDPLRAAARRCPAVPVELSVDHGCAQWRSDPAQRFCSARSEMAQELAPCGSAQHGNLPARPNANEPATGDPAELPMPPRRHSAPGDARRRAWPVAVGAGAGLAGPAKPSSPSTSTETIAAAPAITPPERSARLRDTVIGCRGGARAARRRRPKTTTDHAHAATAPAADATRLRSPNSPRPSEPTVAPALAAAPKAAPVKPAPAREARLRARQPRRRGHARCWRTGSVLNIAISPWGQGGSERRRRGHHAAAERGWSLPQGTASPSPCAMKTSRPTWPARARSTPNGQSVTLKHQVWIMTLLHRTRADRAAAWLLRTAVLAGCAAPAPPITAPPTGLARGDAERPGRDARCSKAFRAYDDGAVRAGREGTCSQGDPGRTGLSKHARPRHRAQAAGLHLPAPATAWPTARRSSAKPAPPMPAFALSRSEAGHPVWGPVYRSLLQ